MTAEFENVALVSSRFNSPDARLACWQLNYWLNLKNCCVPEMGLVTVYWPLMIIQGSSITSLTT